MNAFDFPVKELITEWDKHLTAFWVPVIVGLIFISLAISEIRHGHIRMFILYVFLALCCTGYIICGDEILSKLTGLF